MSRRIQAFHSPSRYDSYHRSGGGYSESHRSGGYRSYRHGGSHEGLVEAHEMIAEAIDNASHEEIEELHEIAMHIMRALEKHGYEEHHMDYHPEEYMEHHRRGVPGSGRSSRRSYPRYTRVHGYTRRRQ